MAELTANMADLWELACDQVPDRVALITGERTLTYAELEERSNRLAHWLAERGVGPGDHVALYLYNGTEYVEGMLAAFKIRAVPVNVNYRYVDHELRYLFTDAEPVVVIHNTEFAERMKAVADAVPSLRATLAVGPGGDYEDVLASSSAERPVLQRSADDLYVIYTGGTTGMPKGVVWRQEDAFYACFGGGDYARRNPIDKPAELVDRLMAEPIVYLPIAPLMHGAAQWTVLAFLLAGGTNVLAKARPRTDYADVWRMITEHKVNLVTIVGDAVARPFVDEYRAHPDRYDASSLFSVGSGGAALSATGRAELAETFPNLIINDGYGASETGAQAGNLGDGRFSPYDGETTVLDVDTLEPIEAGSGGQGRVARRGHIPLRYHKDPEKTAATFVEHDGHRWVLTGDVATVLPDGTIQLFGRGSLCINTGGEKVFPEEVEAALVAHPAVYDALVVGLPDPRWGERVSAVVALVPGAEASPDELAEHCRTLVAGYKVPRTISFVDQVQRSPVGKADYRWAKEVLGRAEPA